MKKLLLVLSGVCILSTVFSQTSKISMGIEINPTVTWLSGNILIGVEDSKFSYNSGINVNYQISTNISIKTGLSYERKGNLSSRLYLGETYMETEKILLHTNFDYMILPLSGSFSFGNNVRYYMDLGAYFGYLLSNKQITEPYLDYPESEVDGLHNSNRADYGVSVGSGILVPVNSKLLFNIGVQSDIGLINTSKYEVIDNGKVKTNSIALKLGLMYKI